MKKTLPPLFILFTLLAACGSIASPVVQPDVSQNGIEIYQARVPVPIGLSTAESMDDMQMDINLAAFMIIKNTSSTDDRLLRVSVDLADASIHETRMDGDLMQMVEVTSIDIPAGESVELKSGGFHIMLMKPTMKPQVGDTVNLTLEFEKAGTLIVPAKVVEQ
ncbi:MAG: copper chaperone PCu(A)C [Anaerolineales bacterium]